MCSFLCVSMDHACNMHAWKQIGCSPLFQYMFEFASLCAASLSTMLAVFGPLNIQIGSYCAGWDKINIIKRLESDSAKVVLRAK